MKTLGIIALFLFCFVFLSRAKAQGTTYGFVNTTNGDSLYVQNPSTDTGGTPPYTWVFEAVNPDHSVADSGYITQGEALKLVNSAEGNPNWEGGIINNPPELDPDNDDHQVPVQFNPAE